MQTALINFLLENYIFFEKSGSVVTLFCSIPNCPNVPERIDVYFDMVDDKCQAHTPRLVEEYIPNVFRETQYLKQKLQKRISEVID